MEQANNTRLGLLPRLVRFLAASCETAWPKEAEKNQKEILARIFAKSRSTAFGKTYAFETLSTYEQFRERVPVFSYETLFPYIERMIHDEPDILVRGRVTQYAKSSGTTNGRSKFIPTPRVYLRGNHLRAGREIVGSYLRKHPKTKLFSGKVIAVVGSMSQIPGSSAMAGDISALMTNLMPWWTNVSRPYPKSLALHTSWPYKAKEIARRSVSADVVSLFGTPTWMLEILEHAKEETGKKHIRDIWPNLEVFFHGAVSFAPYRKAYESLIGEPGIEYCEVYNASEGVFAFEDSPRAHPGEMLLCTNHDVFYEFVPVEDCVPKGQAVPLKDVRVGVQYAMLITTTSGLFRYRIGDVVVFTSTAPYRMKIVGRTTQFINAFGEEVIADNAARAIEIATSETDAEVQAFTAAPTFEAKPAQGAHEWVVEFRKEPKDHARFARSLDEALSSINSDYEAKRAESVVLAPPIVHTVPPGTFRKYLAEEGKLGGQHKVPLLSTDRKIVLALLSKQEGKEQK